MSEEQARAMTATIMVVVTKDGVLGTWWSCWELIKNEAQVVAMVEEGQVEVVHVM